MDNGGPSVAGTRVAPAALGTTDTARESWTSFRLSWTSPEGHAVAVAVVDDDGDGMRPWPRTNAFSALGDASPPHSLPHARCQPS